MGLENIPLTMGRPTREILKTGKGMGLGSRLLKTGVSMRGNLLTINLKEKENYLLREEQFIKACLKMVKWKDQGSARYRAKKFRALIF